MVARLDSDEKYILDLAARVLAEPDYLWQHRFPSLVGDPDAEGKQRELPVDGYFPRHRLVVEYWEKQHSAPVPVMDEGMSVSGMSRGHQRRRYDARRQDWAEANGLRLVILDYRGFDCDPQGRLKRYPVQDIERVAEALRAAGAVTEPARRFPTPDERPGSSPQGCHVCRLVGPDQALPHHHVVWRSSNVVAWLDPFPTFWGSLLVAPTVHRTQVTGDMTLLDYLELQRGIYALSEALRQSLKPERVCILSSSDPQRSAHVCWHLVPCPPGLTYEEQAIPVLDAEHLGILEVGPDEGGALMALLRANLPGWMRRA